MKPVARKLAPLGLVAPLPAMSQEFPSRPISLIRPRPAGGATDTRETFQDKRAPIERLGLLAK